MNRNVNKSIVVAIFAVILLVGVCLINSGSNHHPVELPSDPVDSSVSEPAVDTDPAITDEPLTGDSYYDGVTNLFELKDTELYEWANGDFNFQGLVWQKTWNNGTGIEHFLYTIDDGNVVIGIMTNESRARAAVVYMDFLNPDAVEFEKFLNNLDYTKCESEDPYYGYIATWNSYVLVDATKDYVSYFVNTYPDSLEITKDATTENYLFNLESYAYVLGIDIQESLASLTNIDAMLTMYTNLEQCEYFGIRGYEEYLYTNGFGIIIDNYKDLKTALANPQTGELSEVYSLAQNGGSDPTTDPNSPMYEPPIEGPTTNNTTTTRNTNYPPKVNEYLAYGYKVYKHTMCDAYYYQASFDQYILFCIDNRDMWAGAWAESVAGSVYTSPFGVLNPIN